MFVAQAKVFLKEIETYEPEVFRHVREAVKARASDMDFERLPLASFSEAPDISIDYAVAERTKVAAVVPAEFGWSDIGSWDALWELTPKDEQGNAIFGDVFLEEAKNCYVRSDGIVATVTGVEDLVVVVTEDAVMVSHRDRAQTVKNMVSRLTKAGRPEAINHNRMYRPWGFYESLIQGDRFQVKRIHVDPGHKLSLQKHFHRAEHWVVVAGTALVTRDEEQIMVRENESVYLPLGAVHRLENLGKIPLTLIEVQSGPYLGEDDIVRIEDIYARS
ncbi:Alginate biosynthesis protein AlgA [Komagataeibacter saccharivorans]|uniref:mannose-1-phosphate guanylyltransferase n=2 Tax=Komagataeibacter saccharivorans TaxID=265959 RepID=A0A347WEK4_9PROT|nr:Alginate biosynthesis protein AlgA [Komagataeibacter saccharivorans]